MQWVKEIDCRPIHGQHCYSATHRTTSRKLLHYMTNIGLPTCLQIANLPVVWLPAGKGGWVTPAVAVLPDPECRQRPELAAALAAAGVPLAMDVPPAVAAAMLDSTPGARAMHPALLRSHLQRSADHSVLAEGAPTSSPVRKDSDNCIV